MKQGRSVRLFLIDGLATGLLTAEIMNWTGHVLAGPRTKLEDAIKRDELKRTGVYFLYGADTATDALRVYIDEGDDISKRIFQHNKEKDFWETFIAVTSKDLNLTKAHVRYLESQLIKIVKETKKAALDNTNHPDFDKIPEADKSDMDTFIAEIRLILPVIGADFLRHPASKKIRDPEELSSYGRPHEGEIRFKLVNGKAGIEATAAEIDGEFIILEGSRGSVKEKSSFHEKLKAVRDDAFATGRIAAMGSSNFVLNEDIAFSSPSAAAVFLFGTSRNGRADWIVEGKGIPYGAWKDSLVQLPPG